jgi:Domain of unknown function (DUF4440)
MRTNDWLSLFWAALAIALLASAPARQAAPEQAPVFAPQRQAPAPTGLAKQLEANVRAAWDSFKNKDQVAYASLLAEEFQAVEADGEGERARIQVLREVEHCLYTDYLLQFFQVQPLGPDHAFVTYESTMRFPRPSVVPLRRVFVGELWSRQRGQWKMMRYQETLVR